MPGTRALHERLLDLGAGRIAEMDSDGIQLAVLSLTSPHDPKGAVMALRPGRRGELS